MSLQTNPSGIEASSHPRSYKSTTSYRQNNKNRTAQCNTDGEFDGQRAWVSAFVAIGLGVIALILEVNDPSGPSWGAIVAGVAILVGIATLYRLQT